MKFCNKRKLHKDADGFGKNKNKTQYCTYKK